MIYPQGAIRTTEEMQAMIGKPVYLPLPVGSARTMPRIGQHIIKFHPTRIVKDKDTPKYDHCYWLETEEIIKAAKDRAISVRSDWAVRWGAAPLFFFSNYWFAHVYVQHAENLRV